ncbi:MAG: hypothetical protein AABP62_12670 [Planctomycetota bacterium]
MVGNSSAAGQRPVERTIENLRAVAEPPVKTAIQRVTSAITARQAVKKKPAPKNGSPTKKVGTAKKSTSNKSAAKKVSKTKTSSRGKRTKVAK